uniref:Glycosyltransferase n=2 Tax=Avena strigosa TaxID=38783 RepID=A0A6B9QPN9_9POAL|nr:UGT706C11 [Avena strigosa]
MAPLAKTFVLYPSLGVGHLNPMVELAKFLVRQGHNVIVAVADPPDSDAVSADAVARLSAANPCIDFRRLPAPPNPDPAAHPLQRILDTLRLCNPVLRDFLRSLPGPGAHALLLDMFCVHALDVAAELALPAYFFFVSPAGALAVLLNLPHSYPEMPSFKDMGHQALVRFPGMPPFRAVDMPQGMHDKDSDLTKGLLYQFSRIPEGRGVLVNTLDWLEPTALRALGDGVCVPGRPTPPVFCIGLLVDGGYGEKSRPDGGANKCLAWLDKQPHRSVVFLCFGSQGAFSAAQLKEIALGLESSGHRFLWAVRSPPEQQGEPDLEGLLPAGFLERTRDRGMVLADWVPQAQVLRHEAVGAFVTHGGWNSAMEAIMSGLPMICWPLYAEQALNKVFMVDEMKIAVEVAGYEEGMVKAEEVEAKVRLLMETEEGRKLREMLVVARKMALDANAKGGSSQVAFAKFLCDLENSTST